MQPATIAILAFCMPLVAINACYLLSASFEYVPWCVPYLEGCTSISRAARKGNVVFLFRAIMLPYAAVLVVYWSLARRWMEALGDSHQKRLQLMQWIGSAGAFFLVIYVTALGTDGDFYRAMRRYGVIFFFAFTALAEMLLLQRLLALPEAKSLKSECYWKQLICYSMLFLALANIGTETLLDNKYAANNVIEWNFGLLLALFAIVTLRAWRKSNFGAQYDCG